MKIDINNKTYGIGTNPKGGQTATVSWDEEENNSTFINLLKQEFKKHSCSIYKNELTIKKRLTARVGGMPCDGGNNPLYKSFIKRAHAIIYNLNTPSKT